MMSDENRIISLKTHSIQTTSKSSIYMWGLLIKIITIYNVIIAPKNIEQGRGSLKELSVCTS